MDFSIECSVSFNFEGPFVAESWVVFDATDKQVRVQSNCRFCKKYWNSCIVGYGFVVLVKGVP